MDNGWTTNWIMIEILFSQNNIFLQRRRKNSIPGSVQGCGINMVHLPGISVLLKDLKMGGIFFFFFFLFSHCTARGSGYPYMYTLQLQFSNSHTLGTWKFPGKELNLSHSCSNTRSLTHWAGPGIESHPAMTRATTVGFLTHCPHTGNSWVTFFRLNKTWIHDGKDENS